MDQRVPGSFRDPFGFVFERGGVTYRQVNPVGAAAYDALMASGLHADLVSRGWLVDHEEVAAPDGAHRVLRPEAIPVLSWPFEWPFGALQAAALLTLDVAAAALDRGLMLRDASAFNVQFRGAQPVFIDTLSFAPYREGEPWVAYGQFCRHFLAPLALQSWLDPRLSQATRVHLDGVPLDLALRLLPWGTLCDPGLLVHLHLHARFGAGAVGDAEAQVRRGRTARQARLSRTALRGLLDSLRAAIAGLSLRGHTPWSGYYGATSYGADGLAEKERLVAAMAVRTRARGVVWDLGANTGRMLRAALPDGALGVALDLDPGAVEQGWRESARRRDRSMLHLVQDLTNPTPALGWAQSERRGLAERGPADLVLALALVHHLAIGNHVPLDRVAAWLATLGRHAIVEFVPKKDPQVARMLSGRDDGFTDYHEVAFEDAVRGAFAVEERVEIPASPRTLWRLRRRGA